MAGLPAPGAASAALAATGGGTTITNNITNESQVGTVNVGTGARDAKGIADSIGPQLNRAALQAQNQQGQT